MDKALVIAALDHAMSEQDRLAKEAPNNLQRDIHMHISDAFQDLKNVLGGFLNL
jgi:hypothetical protein